MQLYGVGWVRFLGMEIDMDVKISTSIMCADFLRLGEAVKELEASGADYLHFDIMDGHFVPNFTMGPDILKSIRGETDIPFDTHLMVYEPERYVETFIQAGSDLVVIHVEACRHLHRTINLLRISADTRRARAASFSCDASSLLSTFTVIISRSSSSWVRCI